MVVVDGTSGLGSSERMSSVGLSLGVKVLNLGFAENSCVVESVLDRADIV
jgi:hypothetical protein